MRKRTVICAIIMQVMNTLASESFRRKSWGEEFEDSYIDSICEIEKARYVNGMEACRNDYRARQQAIAAENRELREKIDSLKRLAKTRVFTVEDFGFFRDYCTGGGQALQSVKDALAASPSEIKRTDLLRDIVFALEDATECPGKRRLLEYAVSVPIPNVSNEELVQLREKTGILLSGNWKDTSDAEVFFIYLLHHDDAHHTPVSEIYEKRVQKNPFLRLLYFHIRTFDVDDPTDEALIALAREICALPLGYQEMAFWHGYSNVGSRVVMSVFVKWKRAQEASAKNDTLEVDEIKKVLSDTNLVRFYRLALQRGPAVYRERSEEYLKPVLSLIGIDKKSLLKD